MGRRLPKSFFLRDAEQVARALLGQPDSGQAVLLRAIWPDEGLELMRKKSSANTSKNKSENTRSKKQLKDNMLTHGPGRLCRAFEIDRSLNGTTLGSKSNLFVEEDTEFADSAVSTGPRIGLSPSCAAKDWPLRYRILTPELTPS